MLQSTCNRGLTSKRLPFFVPECFSQGPHSSSRNQSSRIRGRFFPSFVTTSFVAPTIGFVGLGNMGLPMFQNLASSSSSSSSSSVSGELGSIFAYDSNPESREKASKLEDGRRIRIVDSLEKLSEQDVIITMLPGDSSVDTVLESFQKRWLSSVPQGPLPKRIVVDCSTVSPTTSQRWSNLFQETGTALLFDAPVSGGVKGATDGTLTFMLGGCSLLKPDNNKDAPQISQAIQLLLGKMGSRIIECGPHVGAGSATKLCNNLALAAQMIGICEALNLGESLGLDPIVLSSVLNSSTAACWSSKVNNPHPVAAAVQGSPASKNYQGGFASNLMLKDLGLAMQVATEKRVSLPLTSVSKELYQLASLQGRGFQDFGSILQVLRGKQDGK